jgi:hypothetical protein
MKFDERDEGDYRIYAGAFEATAGGYHASVVIVRRRNGLPPVEAYRGELLDNARAFNRAVLALEHAMRHACDIIHREPRMLTV